jgi:hypothetical protein
MYINGKIILCTYVGHPEAHIKFLETREIKELFKFIFGAHPII